MFTPRWTLVGTASLLALVLACSRQSAAPTSPTVQAPLDTSAAPDGSTLKASSAPVSPVGDQQVNGTPVLTASAATMKFGGPPPSPMQYRFQVFNEAGTQVQDSGPVASPSFTVTATMDFKKRHTWRVRPEFQGEVGPWSATASFISPEGGYIRGNEVFDPLSNGITVGERIGPTTFMGADGIRLDAVGSYVRYLIPVSITSGEFSMEIKGLAANAAGNKSKVFGMMEGTADASDYITNPFRFDVQYRGTGGFPPNAITYRILFGGLGPYEPTTEQRNSSVFNLNPNTTYYWKATWGPTTRVVVKAGGINGTTIYDIQRNSSGNYNPNPMYAFIGTPSGRSGVESASIPGTIYKNVWIGARPRP